MRKQTKRSLFCSGLLATAMLLSQHVLALDGGYAGFVDEEQVTASFDDLGTSVTGMLTIGSERYLLQADGLGDGYSGQLHSLASGKAHTVKLTPQGQRVQIQIIDGARPMNLELQKADD